jgi:heterodisulfide reductase subunit D
MTTISRETIEKIKQDVYTCASCGYCRFNCKVAEAKGFESMSARGRMLIAKRMIEGKMPLSKEFIDQLYTCTQCGGCSEMCPTGINYCEIVDVLRKEVVKQEMLPDSQVTARDLVAEHGNPFAQNNEDRGGWIPKNVEIGKKCRDVYFVGCSASFGSNRIPKSVLVALESAGQDITVLGSKEHCCGFPFFRMGEEKRGLELLEKNLAAFKEVEAERVIASCPGCFKTLKELLPEEYIVLHMEEYMAELVKSGKLAFTKPLKKKVIYSDGCDLGRHSGIYEPQREILKAIPELELIEFDYNRADASCCGGPVASHDPDLAHNMSAQKVKEAAEKGADVIVTSCPSCFVNLKEGAKVAGIKMDIQALPMLLLKVVERKKN